MQPINPQSPNLSRWSYKFQRLTLRSAFWPIFRIFAILLCLGVIVGYFYFNNNLITKGKVIWDDAAQKSQAQESYQVIAMTIDGASPILSAEIRTVSGLEFPQSLIGLDLAALALRVEKLRAVETVDIDFSQSGVLSLVVRERVPAFMWRSATALVLLDKNGAIVRDVGNPTPYSDLPLIAGRGVQSALGELQNLIVQAQPIQPFIKGFVRVGQRRWDIVLQDESRILLPASDAIAALRELIVRIESQNLLNRNIVLIDLRNPNRMTVRLDETGIQNMREIRSAKTE